VSLFDSLFGSLLGNLEKVAARFSDMRGVTAAVDWFRNQAIADQHVRVWVVPPDKLLRAPQAGDNRRTDLQWIVSVDYRGANIEKRVAEEALVREGGALYPIAPNGI